MLETSEYLMIKTPLYLSHQNYDTPATRGIVYSSDTLCTICIKTILGAKEPDPDEPSQVPLGSRPCSLKTRGFCNLTMRKADSNKEYP